MQAFMRPTVENKIVVTNPFNERWEPESKVVRAETFVLVNKYDTPFFKFCTGDPLGGVNDPMDRTTTSFWEELVKIRNDASQNAFNRALDEIREAADEADDRRRPINHRRAKLSDAGLAGEVMDIKMKFGALEHATKVLFGCRGSPVWVRGDVDTLAFIQHAMCANYLSNDERPPVRRRIADRPQQLALEDNAEEPGDDEAGEEPGGSSASR
jgi:hypothetical protein